MWLKVFVIISLMSVVSLEENEHCDAKSKDCSHQEDASEKYKKETQQVDEKPDLINMAREHFASQKDNLDRPPAKLDLDTLTDVFEKVLGDLNVPNMDLNTLLGVMQMFAQNNNQADGVQSLVQMAQMLMDVVPSEKTSVEASKTTPVQQIINFMSKKENQNLIMSLFQNENIASSIMPLLNSMTNDKNQVLESMAKMFMQNMNAKPKTVQKNDKKEDNKREEKRFEKKETAKKEDNKKKKDTGKKENIKNKDTSVKKPPADKKKTGKSFQNYDFVKTFLDALEGSEFIEKQYVTLISDMVNKFLIPVMNTHPEQSYLDVIMDSETWSFIWHFGCSVFEVLQEAENINSPKLKAKSKKYESIIKEMIIEKKLRKADENKYLILLFGIYKEKSDKPITEALDDFSDLLDAAKYLQDYGLWDKIAEIFKEIDIQSLNFGVSVIKEKLESIQSKIPFDASKLLNTTEIKRISNSALETLKDPNLITLQKTAIMISDYMNEIDITALTNDLSPPMRQQILLIIDQVKKVFQKTDWLSIMLYFSQEPNREEFFSSFKQHFINSCIEMWGLSKSTSQTISCLRLTACKFNKKKIDEEPAKTMRFWAGALTSMVASVSMTQVPQDVISVYLANVEGALGSNCSKQFKC